MHSYCWAHRHCWHLVHSFDRSSEAVAYNPAVACNPAVVQMDFGLAEAQAEHDSFRLALMRLLDFLYD